MSDFSQLQGAIPALASISAGEPYMRLTSRMDGGAGADADVCLEDTGQVTIAVTELSPAGARSPVCAAVFSEGLGRLVAWGPSVSLATAAPDPAACLLDLEAHLSGLVKVDA